MPHEAAREPVDASLANLTHPDLIVHGLRERDAAGVIGELSRKLGEMDCVPDALSFYQAVLNLKWLSDSPVPPALPWPTRGWMESSGCALLLGAPRSR